MSAERSRTLHVGTEADGFRVTHTPGGPELRIEGWGHWDHETCSAFGRHSCAALEKLALPIAVVLDAGVLKPQAAEGQDALRSFFNRVTGMACSRVSVLATNVLTRMQLTRLARESGLEVDFGNEPTSTPPTRGR